ncbi:MAG: hypothetical protein AB7Q17_03040 [Phycisphaerae bacterium]
MPTRSTPPNSSRRVARPYVGVFFECCGAYARVYRDPGVLEYVGRCPRCLRPLRVRVSREGVPARQLRAR